jgi:type I restriction enzyme R subunit
MGYRSVKPPRSTAGAAPLQQADDPTIDRPSERRTRAERIDPRLQADGWEIVAFDPNRPLSAYTHHAIREYPTGAGPADYVLVSDGRVVGIVEAKKVALGPQNVLTQAERYARAIAPSPWDYEGVRAPFLYATNGEVIWFHDVRQRLNRSREVARFHTPTALEEMLGRDLDAAATWLQGHPNAHLRLRPYQVDANAAIETAIGERKRQMLVAMATGTGKTFTIVNEVYRLMKAGAARRILVLVDRKSLAAQAVRAFASFEPEPGLKFNQIYEVYSQGFQRDDADGDAFSPTKLPPSYLEGPDVGHAFVYVCTIQRMAINLLGPGAVFLPEDECYDEELKRLDVPIHAFDLVIADECHRGYSSSEVSVWRQTLDHFDAVKIGLTATPAHHTTAYFNDVVYRYEYERAVREGYLVDYDAVNVHSEVHLNGVFLQEGEQVGVVDPETGVRQMDLLEDERQFDASDVERKITAPAVTRQILAELRTYADEHQARYGRFPKTLIFAINDLPHTSHADALVNAARDVFGRGDGFVQKITGRADRPLQRIREFRNRQEPGVVVTVDMLTTGVDIPDLEFIVLLRPVKSRILFEQMLGRGTRKGERYPDKSHFVVFDGFGGSLLEYFRNTTGITAEPPDRETRTISQIVEDIWQNRDRDYNVRCLIKRLQRIDKAMSGEARDLFAVHVPNGDLAAFAASLPRRMKEELAPTLELLRKKDFQELLVSYPRPPRTFLVGYDIVGDVTSQRLIRDGAVEYRPEDYITAFGRFVQENADQIDAIGILLDRPRAWSTKALSELRQTLAAAPQHFTVRTLQTAYELHYHKALIDVISMVKHAADEAQPLLTAQERVNLAFSKISAGRHVSAEQQQWLDRIREHLVQNLSIDRDDFDALPVFADRGGWGRANLAFEGELPTLITRLNEVIAA